MYFKILINYRTVGVIYRAYHFKHLQYNIKKIELFEKKNQQKNNSLTPVIDLWLYYISRSSWYYDMWSSPAQHGPCKRPPDTARGVAVNSGTEMPRGYQVVDTGSKMTDGFIVIISKFPYPSIFLD